MALKSPPDRVVGTLIWRSGAVLIGGGAAAPSAPLTGRNLSMPSGERMSLARHICTALAASVTEPPPMVTRRSAPAALAASAASITAARGVCCAIRSKLPAQRLPSARMTLPVSPVLRLSELLTIRKTRLAASRSTASATASAAGLPKTTSSILEKTTRPLCSMCASIRRFAPLASPHHTLSATGWMGKERQRAQNAHICRSAIDVGETGLGGWADQQGAPQLLQCLQRCELPCRPTQACGVSGHCMGADPKGSQTAYAPSNRARSLYRATCDAADEPVKKEIIGYGHRHAGNKGRAHQLTPIKDISSDQIRRNPQRDRLLAGRGNEGQGVDELLHGQREGKDDDGQDCGERQGEDSVHERP